MLHHTLVYALIALSLVGIAAGRLPLLRMNRASIALAFAALLVAAGGIGVEEALAAIDLGTLVLLLAMMLLVANLRLGGFFTAAGAAILGVARNARSLLALVIIASGLLSALFLNDTICVMLTPLVAELCLRSRRDPLPYLVALAVSANLGSCATIIGNPQNILIAAQGRLGFGDFLLRLGPPALAGLGLAYLVVVLAFPREFRRATSTLEAASGPALGAAPSSMDKALVRKSLGAAALMILLLLLRVEAPLAAAVAAALLLVTRRVSPEKVFAEVDYSLLVFFSGLFVITACIGRTPAFLAARQVVEPLLAGGGKASFGALAAAAAASSNLVSNVPTVMLLSPVVASLPQAGTAWYVLALASTFAGNLTLLGSVANLIVAEAAGRAGIRLSFGAYLKVGLPVTLLTLGLGTLWLLAL